jgi:eukaryotic-like serine/threonine-protein kinase
MRLSVGTRLGPYEISGPLGAGGMGEVYRARDTRLQRDVALKTLPAEVADDPARRQRFEIEARAVAALNHPNIVAVFDVGSDQGVSYIVSEFVDGEPLGETKLGLHKLLDIGVQIAGGLAAAHDAGVVHRDLKPGNILLSRESRVKILDFGIAKLRGAEEPAAASATTTQTMRTEAGLVIGTVGYMSPEQVRGLAVDHRSDIFSLGIILHELLGGQRAFQGETRIDTMQAILRQEAPGLPATIPAAVQEIVARCLEKDPANRFQSARDLSFALAALAHSSGASGTVPPVLRRSSRRPMLTVALALAIISLAVAAGRLLWWTPTVSWSGALLGGPQYAMGPRISPDGHTLAFLAFVGELTQVAVMKPESGDWTVLTHNSDRGFVRELSWSPDGSKIYFDRRTDVAKGIFSIPVFGGDEHIVLEDAENPQALPDGSLLMLRLNAERKRQVFRFWPETGQSQPLPVEIDLSITDSQMRVFPDGRSAVVVGRPLGAAPPGRSMLLLLVDLVSTDVRILDGPDPVLSLAPTRDGKSILAGSISGDLNVVQLLSATGQPRVRTLFTCTNRVGYLDSGPDGTVYADQADRPTALVRFAASGGELQRVGNIGAPIGAAALLPGGRVLATGERQGGFRLMVFEEGKEPVPLVNTSDWTLSPATAVGPSEAAFLILVRGPKAHWQVAVANVSTGAILRRIALDKGRITSLAATPDGKTLFIAAGGSIWSVPSAGGEPAKIRAGDSAGVDPAGKYLLVQLSEHSKTHLIRVPLNGGAEQEIPLAGPYHLTTPIGSEMIGKNGRLVVPLQSPDSWFSSPGIIDLADGQMRRIAVERYSDYVFTAWAPDGKIIATAMGLKSALWKFEPKGR